MRALAWLIVAVLAAPGAALADDVQPPGSEQIGQDTHSRAEEIIRAGVELRKAGREREALERFSEAYAIHPSARARAQMGLAAKSLHLYVESERYLVEALAADDPWIHENRGALEFARDVAARHIASLVVTCNVADAELFVNGASVGRLPLAVPLRVTAGGALVEARAPGHARATTNATLSPAETTVVRLELRPLETRPAPGSSPPLGQAHEEPRAGAPPSLTPWIVGAAGVAVVGIGVGSYFGLRAFSLKGERDETCPTPNGVDGADRIPCSTGRAVELDESARSSAIASAVAFTVGAVGLATAAVLLAVELGSKHRSGVRHSTGGSFRGVGVAGARWTF